MSEEAQDELRNDEAEVQLTEFGATVATVFAQTRGNVPAGLLFTELHERLPEGELKSIIHDIMNEANDGVQEVMRQVEAQQNRVIQPVDTLPQSMREAINRSKS